MIQKKWKIIKVKPKKPWKVDVYEGNGAEAWSGPHSHATISGAIIIGHATAGGEMYYFRDKDGNIKINRNENGSSRIK